MQRFKLDKIFLLFFFCLKSLARASSQFERADVADSFSCREDMAPNSLSERVITKGKNGKAKKKSFCMSNEQTPSRPQLAASKSFPAMELVKEKKVSQVAPKDSLVLLLFIFLLLNCCFSLGRGDFSSLFIGLIF